MHNPFAALPDAGVTRLRVAARMFGVSPCTIYNWIKSGRLPSPVKVGPNSSAFPNSVLKEYGERIAKEAA